ncbi:MAG: TetR/AcrR family transcriptional regulator [Coriobacteriales bacterium]|jgi:AcrR family transcriptional regulator|nr:TetR/AcrR family transcriptional regulator [Coriobacteriales bacterium]
MATAADKSSGTPPVQGTKWRIIVAAIGLFAAKGYPGASMRDLAKAVGIKPASIYSHFESKQALLSTAYDVYEYHLAKVLPDIDELLASAEVDDPRCVLEKSAYYFDPAIQEFMNQTVAVAVCEERRDERSSEFVNRVLLEIPGSIIKQLVNRLLELEHIKPLDVEGLVTVFTNYCYSAAVRDGGTHPISIEDWTRGFALLTSVIQPTAKGLAAAGKKGGSAEKTGVEYTVT